MIVIHNIKLQILPPKLKNLPDPFVGDWQKSIKKPAMNTPYFLFSKFHAVHLYDGAWKVCQIAIRCKFN